MDVLIRLHDGDPRARALMAEITRLKAEGHPVRLSLKDEIHRLEHHLAEGPSVGLIALLSVVIAVCTAGVGAQIDAALLGAANATGTATAALTGVSGAMADSALASVVTQATLAPLGVPVDPLSLVSSVATAGLTAGLAPHLNIATGPAAQGATLAQRIVHHAPYQALRAGVSTVSSVATGQLNTLEHRALHAATGAVSGAILGNPVAGAMGAVMAETIAEAVLPTRPSQEQGQQAASVGLIQNVLEQKRLVISLFFWNF